MCRHVYVRLSAEEKVVARKMAGFVIPVYASIVLAVIAVVAVTGTPRQGEQIVATSVPAAR
jgi:hypothetical protein